MKGTKVFLKKRDKIFLKKKKKRSINMVLNDIRILYRMSLKKISRMQQIKNILEYKKKFRKV